MKKLSILFSFTILLLASCKKDKEVNSPDTKVPTKDTNEVIDGKLEGRWNLMKFKTSVIQNEKVISEDSTIFQVGDVYAVFQQNSFTEYQLGNMFNMGTFTVTKDSLTLTGNSRSLTYKMHWKSNEEFVTTMDDPIIFEEEDAIKREERTFIKHK